MAFSAKQLGHILGVADIDYLSARLLFMSGLPTVGMSKASEALEKLLKIAIVCLSKIQENKDLEDNDLKKYGHNLIRLLDEYNRLIPVEEFKLKGEPEILKNLMAAYSLRYMSGSGDFELGFSLDHFDHWYSFLRNQIVLNLPMELREDSKQFGTFLGNLYETDIKDIVQPYGLLLPGDILQLSNDKFENLDIDKNCPLCRCRKD